MVKNKLANVFQNLEPSPMLTMFQASMKYDNLINLGVGQPDVPSPQAAIDALKEAVDAGFHGYPPMNGFPDLRQEISKYWKKNHNFEFDASEVLVTTGGINGMYMVLTAFINPGDEVLVADPCFPSYIGQVKYAGGKLVQIPVGEDVEFVLTAEAIEAHITPKSKLLILNSPSNPTGAVIPREEMEKIAKVVEKHDLVVLSDELYDQFVFDGEHCVFATLPGMRERTYTLGGLSKTYSMTGWRLGYLIATAENLQVLNVLSTDTVMGVPAMIQKAGVAALRDGDLYVEQMHDLYKARVAKVAELVNKTPGLSTIGSKGSFYIFINIAETGMKSVEFSLKMIEEARVVVMPGISFGQFGDDFVRISCNGTPEVLEEAFRRITNAMEGKPFTE